MKTTICSHDKSKVLDSRKTNRNHYTRWRRRLCMDCGVKFTTYELLLSDVEDFLKSEVDRRLTIRPL